jgi:hypothetical protein
VKIRYLIYIIAILVTLSLNVQVISVKPPSFVVTPTVKQPPVEYLFITPQEYVDAVKPLAQWKTQRGISANITTIEGIDMAYEGVDIQAKVKEHIRMMVDTEAVEWVVLGGDYLSVPTRMTWTDENTWDPYVGSDWYYADLDSDWNIDKDVKWGEMNDDEFDWEAEVFVGRLPASSAVEMGLYVKRILTYEKTPPMDNTTWYKRMILAGGILNFGSDMGINDGVAKKEDGEYEYVDQNGVLNYLSSTYVPEKWSTLRLGEAEGVLPSIFPYDQPLSEENLISAITDGAIAVSIGLHGWETNVAGKVFIEDNDGDGLVDSGDIVLPVLSPSTVPENLVFSTSSVPENGEKMPLVWVEACSTGTFTRTEGDCLAEHILKNIGIGCIASEGIEWYQDYWHSFPYNETNGGFYGQGLTIRFWKSFFEGNNHPGQALAEAKKNYWVDRQLYGTANDLLQYYPVWENKLVKQFNLLGDPEIPIWQEIPQEMSVEVLLTDELIFSIKDITNNPVSGVTITLTNEGLYWEGVTDEMGQVICTDEMVQTNVESGEILMTCSAQNFLPQEKVLDSGIITTTTSTPTSSWNVLLLLLSLFAMLSWRQRKK